MRQYIVDAFTEEVFKENPAAGCGDFATHAVVRSLRPGQASAWNRLNVNFFKTGGCWCLPGSSHSTQWNPLVSRYFFRPLRERAMS